MVSKTRDDFCGRLNMMRSIGGQDIIKYIVWYHILMLKKLFLSLPVFGYKRFQGIFERIDSICMTGMNIGCGGDFNSSGEQGVLDYINIRKQGSPLVIFDVGANEGEYSSLVLREFGERVRLHAFEPSIETFNMLSSNISATKNVSLYNIGLSDSDHVMDLHTSSHSSGMASVYKRNLEHIDVKQGQSQRVTLTSLDSFCNMYGIARIDFLKMDVEGHEFSVLKGATRMLEEGLIDSIQFEFGGCNIDSHTSFKDFYYLLKDKYDIFRILKDGLHPIKEYSEVYERYLNTNFLAQKKSI